MGKDKGRSMVQGAILLTGATILVKIIGMFYKVPLGNILGASGMSYFMSAYSIFNPILSLSIAGFPVAVSKLVSQEYARKSYREVRRIFRVSMVLFLVTGGMGCLLMLAGAGPFSRAIGNPNAALAIGAMGPAVLFCCIMSAYRGYYQGLKDMAPTAASQVLESVAKLVCGILLALYVMNLGLGEYDAQGTVFGASAASQAAAERLVLPYGAAGAVLGVTLSTAVGALYLFLRHLLRGDGITREQVRQSPHCRSRGAIAKSLVRIALPVCLAAAVAHVSSLIDLGTIMNRVAVAMERDGAAVMGMYSAYLPQGLAPEELPSFLYGAFNYTSSLFNLVPSLTVALGISALPVISTDWTLHRRAQAAERIASVVKLSALVAIPAGLGLAALARPVLELLYPARLQEVAIAAPLLQKMGVAAVLVGITTPLMSVFQAVGRVDLPVKLMLCGATAKGLCNYMLLAVPSLNIGAAPYGTILCYLIILGGGLLALDRQVGVTINFGKTFGRPLICGIFCGLAAHTSYALLSRVWESRLITLISVCIGGLFYLIFVLFLKIITKNEALMLPKGKKIAKILEKLCFLG